MLRRMEIAREVPLIDGVLATHREALGRDFDGYRHHALRVFHLARRLAGDAPAWVDRLAVACAFHDLGIWTDGTFDYLAPSARGGGCSTRGARATSRRCAR